MATQFSLSYDSEGNPNLVKNEVASKSQATTGTFDIDPYEPIRTVRTDYEFTYNPEDPFSYEQQLIYLQSYVDDNDADVGGRSGNIDNFNALAARDEKGNIISGLTTKEKAMLAAVKVADMPTIAKLGIKAFTPFGPVISISEQIAARSIDPYYNPKDPMYTYTGFCS